jgi:hypothetical protein
MNRRSVAVGGFVFALSSTFRARADEKAPLPLDSNVANALGAILGKWSSNKIEVKNRDAFGILSEKDAVEICFRSDGSCEWTIVFERNGEKSSISAQFLIGTSHVAFVAGSIQGKGDVQLWKYHIKEKMLELETVPEGVKLTLKSIVA